jgi:mycothiol synthase
MSSVLLRAPVPDDDLGVIALLQARDVADFGVPDYTLEDLHDDWRSSDFDLAADALVIEDQGEIVAFADVRQRGTLAVVAPAHEGRGVGTQLLAWTEARQRERGQPCRQWVAASNRRAESLLRGGGYLTVRSYWRMVRESDATPPPPIPPDGISVRLLDPDADAMALHRLDAASFATLPDYQPHTLVQFREDHLDAHDVAPELSLIASRDGEMVGFLLARTWEADQVGFIDILAVHPDHQGRGLGAFLLRTAFARFSGAGLREAQLGVASDNPKALRLYERVGMRRRFQVDTYERSADPAGPAAAGSG